MIVLGDTNSFLSAYATKIKNSIFLLKLLTDIIKNFQEINEELLTTYQHQCNAGEKRKIYSKNISMIKSLK